MKVFMNNKLLAVGILIVFLFTLTTCEKEPTEPEDVAPELPPVQSIQPDLSFFKTNSNFSLNKTALSKNNFLAEAARIVFINTSVILASVVPTAVLAAALTRQPTLEEDGKWHWIFTVEDELNTFSVDLAGWIDTPNAEVVWEVYITSNTHTPDLDHFLWYEGRSKIGNKEGWWIFHDDKSPDSLVDVIRVDWQITDDSDSELIFTNVKQSSSDYGDYLKYGVELTDRFLIYFEAVENRTNTIYWNAETRAGYIEWFNHNDGAKSYWDENLEDTTGPPT